MNTPTLETERLLLRRFTEADIDALFMPFLRDEVNTFLRGSRQVRRGRAAVLRGAVRGRLRPSRGYAYAVCLKAGGGPIGYIKVEMDDSYDFGYALQRPFWGAGTCHGGRQGGRGAGAGGRPALHHGHARRQQPPQRRAVMRRLGMKYCYSYKEQWQPKNFPVVSGCISFISTGGRLRLFQI